MCCFCEHAEEGFEGEGAGGEEIEAGFDYGPVYYGGGCVLGGRVSIRGFFGVGMGWSWFKDGLHVTSTRRLVVEKTMVRIMDAMMPLWGLVSWVGYAGWVGCCVLTRCRLRRSLGVLFASPWRLSVP